MYCQVYFLFNNIIQKINQQVINTKQQISISKLIYTTKKDPIHFGSFLYLAKLILIFYSKSQ
jgi:hypothetical protein